jgi:YegS/Rv2252/BmrU family lipid kinase
MLAPVIREAIQAGFNHFIAIGGDGTVSALANELVRKDIPLAIIPTGSGNVLARELGISLQIDEALQIAVESKKRTYLDAMKIGEQFFVLNIGVGVTANAVRETEREDKRSLGWLAYLLAGLKLLSRSKTHLMNLIVDGEHHQLRCTELMITNSGILGFELFRWGDKVKPGDGVLDIFAFDVHRIQDLLKLGWRMIMRKADENRDVVHFRARETIVVDAENPLVIQADGDQHGTTPFEVEVMPNALPVVTPG